MGNAVSHSAARDQGRGIENNLNQPETLFWPPHGLQQSSSKTGRDDFWKAESGHTD